MAALISIGFFIVLAGVILLYGYRRLAKPAQMYDQLGGVTTFQNPLVDKVTPEESPGLMVSMIEQIGQQAPLSPDEVSAMRVELIAAGYRDEKAVFILYGLKIVLALALLIVSFLFRDVITDNSVLRIVIVVAAGLAGFFGPSLVLESMVDSRREELRLSLPDALDLMVVCVEAGLGLDQAIQYVGRELAVAHPDLSQELQLVNLEMRAGKRRAEALRNLANRTGERELSKLVAILVQTDKFGTSMSDSLRTHSDFMRVRRRQEAEERAGKVGVKLVFPIFFFILPAMLLVAAGPGMLQVFKFLFPMMKQFKG
jgi:tight adherence protein C